MAGWVSGRPLYPEAEMFKNMAYYLRIGNETDDLHPSPAFGARPVEYLLLEQDCSYQLFLNVNLQGITSTNKIPQGK